jgi:hypothetical protein
MNISVIIELYVDSLECSIEKMVVFEFGPQEELHKILIRKCS